MDACRRHRGVRRLSEHRLHVPDELAFPAKAAVLQSLAVAVRDLAGRDPGRPFKDQGSPPGTLRPGHDRRPRDDGRFGPSQWVPNPHRTLAAADERGRAADPRPDPVGRRREAVPHAELLAVPHRAAARPRQRRLGGGLQRGQDDRLGRPARSGRPTADLHRPLVAEHARLQLERRRPATSSPATASTSPTAPACSRWRT